MESVIEYLAFWASIYNFVSFIGKDNQTRGEIARVDVSLYLLLPLPLFLSLSLSLCLSNSRFLAAAAAAAIEKGDKRTMKIHLQAKATGQRDSLCFLERGEGCHFTTRNRTPTDHLVFPFSLPFNF